MLERPSSTSSPSHGREKDGYNDGGYLAGILPREISGLHALQLCGLGIRQRKDRGGLEERKVQLRLPHRYQR